VCKVYQGKRAAHTEIGNNCFAHLSITGCALLLGLGRNRKYAVRVQAVNAVTEGAFSATVLSRTLDSERRCIVVAASGSALTHRAGLLAAGMSVLDQKRMTGIPVVSIGCVIRMHGHFCAGFGPRLSRFSHLICGQRPSQCGQGTAEAQSGIGEA
jgi:hypothetical protein